MTNSFQSISYTRDFPRFYGDRQMIYADQAEPGSDEEAWKSVIAHWSPVSAA